jgi:hypothetical protein
MEEKASLLVSSPRLGVRRPEIATAARMLVEGVYLLLYETHPDSDDGPVDEIEIVRVVHGHRDLTRVFLIRKPYVSESRFAVDPLIAENKDAMNGARRIRVVEENGEWASPPAQTPQLHSNPTPCTPGRPTTQRRLALPEVVGKRKSCHKKSVECGSL